MTDIIATVSDLEACLGAPPLGVQMKVIDHIDAKAQDWIAASPLAFVGFADDHGTRVTIAGGKAGFASGSTARSLSLPASMMDEPGLARPGLGVGALFLVPGVGETLRVNGRVASADADVVKIDVTECYLHCAKALMRSGFWAGAPLQQVPETASDFLNAGRFMALATDDGAGQTDVSPKGDPAGTMLRMEGDSALYADRPGNRRADSFRNIIARPAVSAVVIIPGSTRVAVMSGRARITTDETMRSSFAVEGKAPKIVTVVEGVEVGLRDSPALARAGLWPASTGAGAGIDPSAVLVAHIKLNKTKGLQAMAMRTAVNRTLVDQGLKSDYKTNLY